MRAILGLLPIVFLLACDGRRDDRNVLAKIGKEKYYQSDLEKLVQTLPPTRQTEVLQQPDERRKFFEQILKQRLMALAAKEEGFADNKDLQKRLAVTNQRIITQYYYETFLGENAGFSDAELQNYFKANLESFKNDSGKTPAFAEVKSGVVDSLLLSKANLDSFYLANSSNYEQKASCDISFIRTESKKDAEAAYKSLTTGSPMKQVSEKFDMGKQLRNAKLVKGETHWELGSNYDWDNLFFHESSALKPGTYAGPISKEKEFVVVRADSCNPHTVPKLQAIFEKVATDYISSHRTKLSEQALDQLKAKYAVKIVDMNKPLTDEELKPYYEANKESYMSPPTYSVYHIEAKAKEPVSAKLQAVKDLDAFKKLAGEISENSWTRASQGEAGVIKRDHALPYGIGMLPTLFPALDSLKPGAITAAILNPETEKWHWFWLVEKKEKQIKPFDRVKLLVRQDIQSDQTRKVAPEDTLATFAGSKVIRESDVIFLAEEVPEHLRSRYTRDRLVDYLLTWELMTLEAEALKLTENIKLQASLIESQDRYWADIYRDSVLQKSFGLESSLLQKTFTGNRDYFLRDGEEGEYSTHVKDIAAFLTLDSNHFALEYHLNPERYTRSDTLLPFEKAGHDIFQNLKSEGHQRADNELVERLKKRFNVVIVDESLKQPKISDANAVFLQAQNLHYDRNLEKALELYEKLRTQFPENHSLQDSVAFGMAQIFIEQEQYQKALSEYRRVSYLYPKSPNEYKAQFMVGFIQAEHIKNDSAAVRTFRKMLEKHPKSDLSDDADWMIRNIESGGALMPVLEDEAIPATPAE